jgi:hypothetical protein
LKTKKALGIRFRESPNAFVRVGAALRPSSLLRNLYANRHALIFKGI